MLEQMFNHKCDTILYTFFIANTKLGLSSNYLKATTTISSLLKKNIFFASENFNAAEEMLAYSVILFRKF